MENDIKTDIHKNEVNLTDTHDQEQEQLEKLGVT